MTELTELEFLEEVKQFVFKLNLNKINQDFINKKSKKIIKKYDKNTKLIKKMFINKYNNKYKSVQ